MIQNTKEAFIQLGLDISEFLSGTQNGLEFHSELEKRMPEAFHKNGWFTGENIRQALQGISYVRKF